MSDTGQIALGVVRIQAQQKADMLNSQFLSVVEWNAMISSSYKELYDLLVTTYGENYFVAPAWNFTQTGNGQQFTLPNGATVTDSLSQAVAAPFYKLLGVDLSDSGTWVTLKPFNFVDRNKFLPGSMYEVVGYTNLRYKLMGGQLWFNIPPSNGQAFRVWYVPKPVNLQPVIVCTTAASSTTVSCADTTQLSVGQNVADYAAPQGATAVFPAGTTITAITPNTSFTVSANAASSGTLLAAAWSDTYTFDAVSGWEEYIVLDAAIKALIKEESDPSALLTQKAALTQRIMAAAPSRDAAIAPTVSDAAALESPWGYYGYGGWGEG